MCAGRSPLHARGGRRRRRRRGGPRLRARSRPDRPLPAATRATRRALLPAGANDHQQPGVRRPALSTLDALLPLCRLFQSQPHPPQGTAVPSVLQWAVGLPQRRRRLFVHTAVLPLCRLVQPQSHPTQGRSPTDRTYRPLQQSKHVALVTSRTTFAPRRGRSY